MMASTLALSLLGLAAASPVFVPHYPDTVQSKGFHLVVNVTDPDRDLTPSVKNAYVTSLHVGAGLGLLGVSHDATAARIFYINGTSIGHPAKEPTRTLSDGGTPPFPFSISLVKDEGSKTVSTAHLDAGFNKNSDGVGESTFPEAYAFLTPETWVACDEALEYYQGKHYTILKQAATTVGDGGEVNYNIPKECVAVRLLPEATKLNDLPKGATASHEFALDSRTYKSVKAIDWTKYGP